MSRKETLSLLPFSCQNISIAYSTVKKFSTTEFSRPTQVCVDEGERYEMNRTSFIIRIIKQLLLQSYLAGSSSFFIDFSGLPGPPNKLSFSIVTEDLRPNFIRHAIVNVSWDQPQGE